VPDGQDLSERPLARLNREREGGAGGSYRLSDRAAARPDGRSRSWAVFAVARATLGLVSEAAAIFELNPTEFLGHVGEFVAIYAAAMNAEPAELPTRRAIMERHARNPGFRALAVSSGEPTHVVAFTYGFRGIAGQWWHDVVRAGIVARSGLGTASGWLDCVVEIAEVHVHPDFQARGIGRQMVLALTDGRSERTAVLSTRDARTPARKLYYSLGFSDLLTSFLFPGGGPPYAVMGAVLPLARRGQAAGQA
jgi:ribosomal protein S18 acetylase RimI-like enzyme